MTSNQLRYSWKVAQGQLPAETHDAETIKLTETTCALSHNSLWKEMPQPQCLAAWRELIAAPIIEQMYKTHDPQGVNLVKCMSPEMLKEVFNRLSINPMHYAYVFVATGLQTANAYAARLLMSYALTTQKIPLAVNIAQVVDVLRMQYGGEEDYQSLLKPGLLVITDVIGEIPDIDRIDSRFVKLLTERHNRGKVTVFVMLLSNDQLIEQILSNNITAETYREILKSLKIYGKGLGVYLSPENAHVYTYTAADAEGETYVCRTFVSH